MATSKYFFALAVLVASSYAAPNHEPIPLKIPDECKGKGFCPIKPEGYDAMEKFITHLLTDKFIASMGDRNGVAVSKEELSPEEDWHNCPYRKTVQSMYTYSLSNETNDFDYIIQHKLLTQPIEIVTCATDKIEAGSSNEECFQDIGLSSFKMKSMCQTTTSKRSLLVYDFKTGQIKKKPFDVPCCCSCVVSETV